MTFFCPQTEYIPVGDYFGPGYVRFGGDGTFTDTGTYQASSVPGPVFARLHKANGRGRNTFAGANVFASANIATANFLTGFGDQAGAGLPDPARTTLVGAWAGKHADALKYSDAFGASAGQEAFANRVTLIGTNAGKWLGCQDPVTAQHDFFNLGGDLDDPGDDAPEIWAAKNFEAVLPTVRTAYLDGTIATVYVNPASPAANQIAAMGNVKTALLATSVDQVKGNVAVGRDALIRRKEHPMNRFVGLDIDAAIPVGHGDGIYAGRAQVDQVGGPRKRRAVLVHGGVAGRAVLKLQAGLRRGAQRPPQAIGAHTALDERRATTLATVAVHRMHAHRCAGQRQVGGR
jgi:hypothetical protein